SSAQRGLGSSADSVPLDLVDEGGTGDPELLSGTGSVPAVMLQGALDVLPFEIVQTERRVSTIADARPRPEFARQMLDADRGLAPAKNHGALEHVAHLAHV